jgi:hypothetical protein
MNKTAPEAALRNLLIDKIWLTAYIAFLDIGSPASLLIGGFDSRSVALDRARSGSISG